MTLQEILKAKGLTDEQIKEVIGEMKQNKIFTASEENLDVRYGKLKTDHDALTAKDAESQKLIAELQKATKGQEAVQGKITEYEATIAKQQEELIKTKIESATKIALLGAGAKATDIDYLIFKIRLPFSVKLVQGRLPLLTRLHPGFQFEGSESLGGILIQTGAEGGSPGCPESPVRVIEFDCSSAEG